MNFRLISNTVRQLGVMHAVCTTTNPTSLAPPYWPELEDTDEGRRELAKRIRTLFALDGSHLHGDERAHMIKKWAAKELANV